MLETIQEIYSEMSTGVLILLPILAFVGLVAKWRLFDKCGLSRREVLLGTFLPIYDFYLTLKIVGRPQKHLWFILIPVFNLFFVIKVLFELLNCFGKFSILDYAMAVLFNILYVLNLGLAYNEVYYGSIYDKTAEEVAQMKAKAQSAMA